MLKKLLTTGSVAALITGSTLLVPVDFALNRPRRLTPEERAFLDKYLDDGAPA